jgi:EAL domain-containing protein (putative c-di-GMP-specific phosphodiesterase class I)
VQYSFDTLKIDRSFVSGLPGEAKQYAVVQAIIGMAHALGYRVVAEGVETIEQASVLASHGCLDAQGFLYSRPIPADQFAGLLRRGEIRVPGMQDGSSQPTASS